MDLQKRLLNNLDQRVEKGLIRTLKKRGDLIDFSSNDYLGLGLNKELNQKLSKVLDDQSYSFGSGGSRLLAGNSIYHESLERVLATTHKGESSLLFNSGYVANLGFFSCVPAKGDVILYDAKIHACVKDGMRLSYAKHYSFAHNDLRQLEKKIIEQSHAENIFIAVESIYSMDGDHCPLQDIVTLAEKYDAYVVLDEAHSTAVMGEKGAGMAVAMGLEDQVFARIHTFGKGVGAHGACVVGSRVLTNYLLNNARSFIYTTSLPDHQLVILTSIYGFLKDHSDLLQDRLLDKISLFKREVKGRFIASDSAIQSWLIEGNENVKLAAEELRCQGFDVRAVLSPTVPEGEERIRICIHVHNSDSEIKELAQAINKLV